MESLFALLLTIPFIGLFIVLLLTRHIMGVPQQCLNAQLADASLVPKPFIALFDEKDAALRTLGFKEFSWFALSAEQGELLGPAGYRIYRHERIEALAFVALPYVPQHAAQCWVEFISYRPNKVAIDTVNGWSHLVHTPLPRLELHEAGGVSLAEQWRVHQEIIAQAALRPIGTPEQELAMFRERASEHHLIRRKYWTRGRDGLWRYRMLSAARYALRILWGMWRTRKQNLASKTRIPAEREYWSYRQYQRQRELCKPPGEVQLKLLVLSTFLFAVIGALWWSWELALAILVVLFIHEYGHYFMMRKYGYRDLQIMLIPLVGAVATGREGEIALHRRVWVYLAGPLPGLVIGVVLCGIYAFYRENWLLMLAVVFLLVNYLNLLPLWPLDGGGVVRALLSRRSVWFALVFTLLSAAGLGFLAFKFDSGVLYVVAAIAAASALRIRQRQRVLAQIEQEVAKVPSDEESRYVAVVRVLDATAKEFLPTPKRFEAIDGVLRELEAPNARPLHRAGLAMIYLLCLFLPIAALYAYGPTREALSRLDQGSPSPLVDELREWSAAQEEALKLSYVDLITAWKNERERVAEKMAQIMCKQTVSKLALNAAATTEQLRDAEMRLGIIFPTDYDGVLRVADGWQDPQDINLLRVDGVQWLRDTLSGNELTALASRASISVTQLQSMLLIGSADDSDRRLLLEIGHGGESPVYYVGVDGEAEYKKSLSHFIVDKLLSTRYQHKALTEVQRRGHRRCPDQPSQ